MELGRPIDLSGLATALGVEAAGAWHLYSPNSSVRPTQEQVLEVYAEIMRHNATHKLPTDPRLMRLLVDAGAANHGESTRASGWQILGISPNRGRTLLSNNLLGLTWGVWFTAINFGLGYARHTSPAAYFSRSGSY